MIAPLKKAQMRWTDEQTAALCAALHEHPTRAEAASALGLSLKAVTARIHTIRNLGDPRLPARKIGGRKAIDIPSDFAAYGHRTNLFLCAHFQVSKQVIARWRRESGTPKPRQLRTRSTFVPKLMPENFAAIAPALQLHEARAFFGVGDGPLRRWAMNCGVTFRRPANANHRATAIKVDRDDSRDMSRAGMAADYLKRFGPVFRCNERGNPEGRPTHWRRGSFVLTDQEIIERAERNGWRHDAWKALAA
ncbi:MAG: hypothetical protein M3Y22_04085 [Pseudomonadota bacterium]|nr:hypothetical protein [Pseudomonadota bacterium]